MTLRFDVNLSILFTELPLLERPAAARTAGFTAAEFWWPFGTDPTPPQAEIDAFVTALDDAGVRLAGLNFIDDIPVGGKGLVSVPEAADRFRANIEVAVGIAERTGCHNLNALYGNRIDGVAPELQDELAVAHLALAAKAASRIGATVMVEALNSYESPAYAITSTEAAIAVIERVEKETGAENLSYLCDLYHLARMDEDLSRTIAAHAGRFGHVQVADVPGRNEPGTGRLDFDSLFAALIAAGYRAEEGVGSVGLEYKPSTGVSAESFGWLAPELRAWTA